MVQCFDKLSHQRQVSKKKQQVAMFQRSISIDTHRSNQLSHPTSDSSMSTSPAAVSTASVVTPLGLASPPTGPQQSTSPLDNNSNQVSVTVSNANSVVHHSIPSYESVSSANLSRSSSIVSAVVENSSLHSHHLVPMYANGANTLFGTNNSAPSTLVMTPPSPYSSDMSPSIMGTDSSSLMQHPSWYHTTMRTQHPSYPEMIGGDWSNPVCANTGFTNSASSPLSACAYQMSLPGAYSSPISSVYHPHHGGCRPEQAETAFYHQRFNASYPHNSYYPHAFFNSTGSPTGPTNHSFPPLSVGTSEMNQMSFATSALLNSSPDSGLTVSSEGNESPSLASHVAESHGAMLAANLTSASLLNAGRSHQALSAHADLDEDIKPNIGQHGPGGQQQEATSTTSNSSNGTSNVSNHLGMYNWMKKSTNSSSSQSSTGKTRTKDKYRVVYTETQRVELEKEFHFSRYITIKRKSELACQLMLSERQVKIWFQNRRAKDRKQQRKRDEMLKKEKKDNTAAVVVSNHSAGGGLLSQGSVTPGVLVVSNSGLGNSCSSSANQLLVTSVTGSTIHHHTPPHQGQSRHSAPSHSVAVVAPTHHFSTQAPPGTVHHSLHSAQTGTIIHSGSTYRDILSGTISQMTATTPTVVSEIAH